MDKVDSFDFDSYYNMAFSDNGMREHVAGHVYTLRLQNNCYYVGWSAHVESRIAHHFLGDGAKWTQLHPPIEVLSVLPGDHTLEKITTIACMCQHGWQCVRGASWCQVELKQPPAAITQATQHIQHKRKRSAEDT